MTKIVYNARFGGFDLSEKAVLRYAELKGFKLYTDECCIYTKSYFTVPLEERSEILTGNAYYNAPKEDQIRSNQLFYRYLFEPDNISRSDPILVQVVEELGAEANGPSADLKIAEVSSGTKYRIDEYDGNETVMTIDDYDWLIA